MYLSINKVLDIFKIQVGSYIYNNRIIYLICPSAGARSIAVLGSIVSSTTLLTTLPTAL